MELPAAKQALGISSLLCRGDSTEAGGTGRGNLLQDHFVEILAIRKGVAAHSSGADPVCGLSAPEGMPKTARCDKTAGNHRRSAGERDCKNGLVQVGVLIPRPKDSRPANGALLQAVVAELALGPECDVAPL